MSKTIFNVCYWIGRLLLDRLFEVFEKPLKLADFKVCNPHLLGLTMLINTKK